MGPSCAIGPAAGLLKIGLHVQRVPRGYRISWPHAESKEEEFVYVLAGESTPPLSPLRSGRRDAAPRRRRLVNAVRSWHRDAPHDERQRRRPRHGAESMPELALGDPRVAIVNHR
jgi:hypothetical protein